MRKAAVLCALLALAASAPLSVEAAQSRPLPEGVLVLAEVAKPTEFEQALQALLWRLSPGAQVSSLEQDAAEQARTDDPTTLDLSMPLQWVILRGEPLNTPVAVFGVKDSERYLDSLSATVHGGETDGNLYLYQEDPGDAVGEGVWDAGPAQPLAIALLDSRVAIGRSADGVRKVAALVEAGAFGSEAFFPDADAGGAVRLRELLGILAERGQDPFVLARDQVAGFAMMAPQQGASSLRMFQMLIDAAESAAVQMVVVRGTVSLTPEAMVYTAGVQPAEGSTLATYLPTMHGGRQELLDLMPASAAAAFGGHMGDAALLMDAYSELISSMAPPDGSADDAVARVGQRVTETVAVLDGRFANALLISPEGFFTSAKAAGVNDPVRAEELFNALGPMVEDLSKVQQGVGTPFVMHVTVEPNALTYAGHAVTKWNYDFEFLAPDAAVPGAVQAAAIQKGFMDAMIGPDLTAYSTFRGADFLTVQGPGTLDVLKAALDGSITPVAGAPRFTAATAGMPEQPVIVGYLAPGEVLGAYMRAATKAMQAAGGFFPPFFANLRFAPAPAVGFAAAVDETGALEARVVVPVATVTNIVDGFRQAFTGGAPMMP